MPQCICCVQVNRSPKYTTDKLETKQYTQPSKQLAYTQTIIKKLPHTAGLEIISRLAPVKLSGQTYFCSDTTHFWPDKSPLRHISTKFPPSPCSMMFTYQTSTFSKPLLYMEPRTHCRKSGMHGTATTFGKINITFVHASIASVLCLLYR